MAVETSFIRGKSLSMIRFCYLAQDDGGARVLLYWKKGELEFTTDVEDWMANQMFTEVFRYGNSPSNLEMEITRELDDILQKVIFGRQGIKDTIREMAKCDSVPVMGQIPKSGQEYLNSKQGRAVDGVFKSYLKISLDSELKSWKPLLFPTEVGKAGPDVYSPTLRAAWDVTTVRDVWPHVERDVMGKSKKGKPRMDGGIWDNYYLLVWDEPRTNHVSEVKAIEAGRLQS